MKKTILMLAALLAMIAAPLVASAHSGAFSAFTYTGSATSGNALTSDTIDARELEALVIIGSVATADRTITVNCLSSDEAAVLFAFPAVTAAAAGQAKQTIVIDPYATVPGTAPTGTTIWNVALCPKVQVVMASAAGTASLDIMGRRQQVAASVSKCAAGKDASGQTTLRVNPWCYESGSVTAGAALASGVIDTRRVDQLTVIAEAVTTGRTLVVSCTNSSGTSLFDFAGVSVGIGAKVLLNFSPRAPTPGAEPAGVTHFPVHLCRYMKASIAAAGAASAKLATYTRG